MKVKRRLTDNWGLKVLAFLIAMMSWIIVVNIDDPVMKKTFYDIPVSVVHEEVLANGSQPKTYEIVDNTETVKVVVSAKRKVLSKIKETDIVAVADMKELTLNTQIPIDVVINGYEGKYDSVTALPRNLQIKLEDEETRRFPIVPTTKGTVRDGYALGEISAQPEKVSFRGPKTIIDSIKRVEASVSVSGLSKDSIVASELKLYDADNNEISQNRLANNLGEEGVFVSVKLLKTKNVALKFDVSKVEMASGYRMKGITYEPTEIQVMGAKKDIDRLDEIQIPASALEINGLKESMEKIIEVEDYLPENIQLADENAGSVVVKVSVQMNGTKVYEITVGSITVNNLSDDLYIKYKTVDALEIQVRGPEEVLRNLDIAECVSLNLKEYTKEGEYAAPVVLDLPDECTVLKDVTVDFELIKKD